MKIIPFLIFTLLSVAGYSQEFKQPKVIYSTSDKLEITHVQFSKETTAVTCSFTGNPYTWIRLSSSTIARDESGHKHPVVRTEGIILDSLMRLTDNRTVSFTIHFAPLPSGTEIFDIIEGRKLGGLHIYGIHDAGTELHYPCAKEEINLSDTKDEGFRQGYAILRGTIGGYSYDRMPNDLKVYYNFNDQESINHTAVITPDGRFCCPLLLEGPTWSIFSIGLSRFYDFYLRPGDTLDIDIRHFGQWNEEVLYRSTQGYDCYEALMNEGDYFFDDHSYDRLFRTEYQFHLDEKVKQVDYLQDYLSWKYHLSPWEVHLMKVQQRLQFAFLQAFFMDSWRTSQREDHVPVPLPEGSLNLFQPIQWNDNTIAISRVWHAMPLARYVILFDIDVSNMTPKLKEDTEKLRKTLTAP